MLAAIVVKAAQARGPRYQTAEVTTATNPRKAGARMDPATEARKAKAKAGIKVGTAPEIAQEWVQGPRKQTHHHGRLDRSDQDPQAGPTRATAMEVIAIAE